MNHQALSSFIWSVADLLRGDYKQSEYGRVILPFTVLRRLDCVLEATKPAVLAEFDAKTKASLNPEPFLLRKAGQSFYNTSPLDLVKLLGDQDHIRQNLYAYVQSFSPAARDIFERFDFYTQVERLAKANLLYLVTEKFANIDLHPEVVDNASMGLVFEELIRKFAEISNETAGEHFTPREVIRLMVNLLFIEDDDVLTPGNAVVRTIYDPTAGTGGMLSVAGEYLLEHNPQARLFGDFTEAELVTACDAAGAALTEPQLVTGNDNMPVAPEGGRLKRVPISRIFRNEEFGYTTITVERPLRDEAGNPVLGVKGKQKGKPQADSALRETENVPLLDDIQAYFKREVLPHALDAWIDKEKSKVGYEIPFSRHFYVFEPPRGLHAIDEELKAVSANIMKMLEDLAE